MDTPFFGQADLLNLLAQRLGIDPTMDQSGLKMKSGLPPTPDEIARFNGQPMGPTNTTTPDQAATALYGLTGIPDIQQGIQAMQRGEYLPGFGQAAYGALNAAALAAPVARAGITAGKALMGVPTARMGMEAAAPARGLLDMVQEGQPAAVNAGFPDNLPPPQTHLDAMNRAYARAFGWLPPLPTPTSPLPPGFEAQYALDKMGDATKAGPSASKWPEINLMLSNLNYAKLLQQIQDKLK